MTKQRLNLFDILLEVSELKMDVDTAEKKILKLFNNPDKKLKTCPHCGRNFENTEVASGIFCCAACEHGY